MAAGVGLAAVGAYREPPARKHSDAGPWIMICAVQQLGLVDYAEAIGLQREKVAARKADAVPDTLLLLEHPHVYTLGRNGKRGHLLAPAERLADLGAEVFETDRGGDITYHGPGHRVGYRVLGLARRPPDVA